MTKREKATPLKLPDDFLGTVKAFLNTPPPDKVNRQAAVRKERQKARRKAARPKGHSS